MPDIDVSFACEIYFGKETPKMTAKYLVST